MKNLKNFNQFIKESVEEEVEEDEIVYVPVVDKLGFYEPKPFPKSHLADTLGFNKGQSVPFFKTEKQCKSWCDEKDIEMYQNMDR